MSDFLKHLILFKVIENKNIEWGNIIGFTVCSWAYWIVMTAVFGASARTAFALVTILYISLIALVWLGGSQDPTTNSADILRAIWGLTKIYIFFIVASIVGLVLIIYLLGKAAKAVDAEIEKSQHGRQLRDGSLQK